MTYISERNGAKIDALLDKVESGDLDNLYVADFTIEDLDSLSETNLFLNINARALIGALAAGKAIGIRQGNDESMSIASAYREELMIHLTVISSNGIMYKVSIDCGPAEEPEVADNESGRVLIVQVIPIETSFAPFLMHSVVRAVEGPQTTMVLRDSFMSILEVNKPLFIHDGSTGVVPASYSITKQDEKPTAIDIDIVYNNGSYHIHWDITDDISLYLSQDTVSYTSFSYIPTTYNELKKLRDNNQLTPGAFYRITDYTTTTSQENTSAASHPFDVIVLALSDNTLSEEAYTVHSDRDGDGYFANSNLSAWKIWYCLDNDTTRFAWAGATKKTIHFHFLYAGQYGTFRIDDSLVKEEGDTTYYGYKYIGGGGGSQIFDKNTILWYPEKFPELSTERTSHIFYEFIDGVKKEREIFSNFFEGDVEQGKGVIYRMIDEGGNDCPYDFKNILFTRYELLAPNEYQAVEPEDKWLEQLSNNVREMFNAGFASYKWAGIELGEKYWEDDRGVVYSQSTAERKSFYTFSDITNYEANEITVDASLSSNCHSNKMGVAKIDDVMSLPNNVFFGGHCSHNSFGGHCFHNSFGNNFHSNSFGNYCHSNSFGEQYSYNSFGEDCFQNNFGDGSFNSFNHGCCCNSLGSGCSQNKFDVYASYNSFGTQCNVNKFGEDCFHNSFGDYCDSNSFGNGCAANSFGNYCNSNSFGDYCGANSFGHGYYFSYNTFGKMVQNVHLSNDEQGEYDNCVQNYHISNGIQGTYEEPITLNVERNRIYETTVARNHNGEIRQFCVADLI